ncbi:hypothetical protein O5964_30950 [Escherichia coli]|nr:hypothetical protein [Escherichia coli]
MFYDYDEICYMTEPRPANPLREMLVHTRRPANLQQTFCRFSVRRLATISYAARRISVIC